MNQTMAGKRLELFPITTKIIQQAGVQRLAIADQTLNDLAEKFGTPLYVYDQATLDSDLRTYNQALAKFYPGEAGITYAGKAYLCLAIAQWAARQQLWLDCTGAGELAVAQAAGVPRAQIITHGVNKSSLDVLAGIRQSGTLVVDNLSELESLLSYTQRYAAEMPNLWLRYRPGIAVETHSYTQTGQDDSKFGMSASEIEQAVRRALAGNLPLTGIHFHQGSKFQDPSPLREAIFSTIGLLARIKTSQDWVPAEFSPGGGWGVSYHEDDLPHPPITDYVSYVSSCLTEACQQEDLPLPKLQLEPGRSLVARAGVAIYRAGSVKHTTNRRWILLDGGLADNPRPALYGSRYSALPTQDPTRAPVSPTWLGGPYCESGDVLIEDLPFPEIAPGELIAVPVSGAYQLSMSSNYNGARRPAVVWLVDGEAHLIQEREKLEDIYRRDHLLS
jgi:diaminopimelate decarboxylase